MATLAVQLAAQTAPPAGANTGGVVLKPVEIVGAGDDSEQRRLSTAAKIIIGRDEIERYGDSTTGELLKRLPGITMPGRPGRGGAPRMRGLGGGYTQILVDGERVARGFSLDDLAPDQIERIEILRAPTAETGARAIGGSINIITRGGYRKRINTVHAGFGGENGYPQKGASWSRNDTLGDLIYNFTLSAMQSERNNNSTTASIFDNLTTDQSIDRQESTSANATRSGMHLNGRLQWRTAGADSLILMPMLIAAKSSGGSSTQLQQNDGNAPYDSSLASSENRFAMLRLASQWQHPIDAVSSLNLSANLGQSNWNNNAQRQNFGGVVSSTGMLINNDSAQHDQTFNGTVKYSRTLADQHNLVTGAELALNRRNEVASTLQNGESPLTDFDGNLQASSLRSAIYAQDEWKLTPNWSAHAGLRWEGITTRGSAGAADDVNRSAVLTPLLHAVWRPDPARKDQLRLSLTRSYKSPDLQNMIGRPNINSMFPGRGSNEEIHPDTVGNPALKPELASGLDLAFEHYMAAGGLLSVNLFYRHINDLMRRQTTLEVVSWADVPRWVARQQNVGDAVTQGLELEAKLRLSEVFVTAPKIDLRANASVFYSRVQGVPGPDNRLDQQPDGVLNLGAEYKLTGLPLTLGGNLNFTPGYNTQLSSDQTLQQGAKSVFDAYGVWTFTPALQLRLSLSNLTARDYWSGTRLVSSNFLGQSIAQSSQTRAPSFVNVQLRLEMKL